MGAGDDAERPDMSASEPTGTKARGGLQRLVRVLRSMRADDRDGLPLVGRTARYLAARRDVDIIVAEDGTVGPGTGGASVSPLPIANLHPLRLPRELGGLGKDPVFEFETDDLPDELDYRPDPANPEGHGFIEPSRRMDFEDYERAMHATRDLWRPMR